MITQEKFEEIVVDVLERDISSNEDQKKAVFSKPDQSLFLVAGPGSGKTKVITHRVAHLINEQKIPPEQILTITFTKAAASEMVNSETSFPK